MPRTRTIKPEFWDDEKLAKVSRDSRLVFVGLWSHSDDYGICKGNPVWLKSKIFPFDEELKIQQFSKWLKELEGGKFIIPFVHNGESYYFIRTFCRHQTIDHPSKQRYPTPPEGLLSRDTRDDSRDFRVKTETETETETETINRSEKTACGSFSEKIFEELWKQWPLEGRFKRKFCRMKFLALCKQGKLDEFRKTARGYSDYLRHKKENENFAQQPMHLSTFLNNWEEEKERYINFKYQPRL